MELLSRRMSWTVVYLVLPFLYLSVIHAASGQGQMTNVKVLERANDWQCPLVEERETARNELHQIASSVIASTICNGTPGWRRVAFVNMTDTSYNCPAGLNLTSYSKRTCGQSLINGGCSSTTVSVGDLPYSRVCGRIRGYQFGGVDAFYSADQDIESHYIDGVSLTYGGAGRRQHIWTFAAGATEVRESKNAPNSGCPCETGNYGRVPAFIGSDYFCESGLNSDWYGAFILYTDDILWDGQGCISTSTCCQFNNPPWFTKSLTTATTDDIELRLCSAAPVYEDVPIEVIELYVQ